MDQISAFRVVSLHPVLRQRAIDFIGDCAVAGIYLRVTRALATKNEQHALYIQGREPLDVVNKLRLSVGLAPVTEIENNPPHAPVTHADYFDSMHCYGLAFDADPSDGALMDPFRPNWKVQDPKWVTVLEIAKAHKLAEGAQWTLLKRDYPHFYPVELDANPTQEMQQALKDAGIDKVWELLRTTLLPF